MPPAEGPWFVYVLCEEGAEQTGPAKIGTARNVEYRVDGLAGGNPRRLVIVRTVQVIHRAAALRVEASVHDALAPWRIPNRDWFNLPPAKLVELIMPRGQ